VDEDQSYLVFSRGPEIHIYKSKMGIIFSYLRTTLLIVRN